MLTTSSRNILMVVLTTCLTLEVIGPRLFAQDAPAPAPPTPPAPWPAASVMPWRTVGIDAHERVQAKDALEAARTALVRTLLQQPRPLGELAPAPLPINLKRRAAAMTAGTLVGGNLAGPIVVEPLWCSLRDYHLIFLTVVDARLGTLVGSTHTSYARADWQQAIAGERLGAMLSQVTGQMAAAALGAARPRIAAQPDDALHLGFDLGRQTTRRDVGSSHCVNMLLEERLAGTFTVVRSIGGDRLAEMRRVLHQAATLRRPTRRVITRWYPDSNPSPPSPITYRLEATFAESVLGQPIPRDHSSDWRFTAASDGPVAFQVPADLMEFIQGEQDSLRLDDWPQVSKIDRAWVWLDRGRAWGLQMGDRMVADSGDGTLVEGHVVRFYGPAAAVTSPRGFPIREGAILYIRNGQKLTRMGMEFRFDPTAYPTPWPPRGETN